MNAPDAADFGIEEGYFRNVKIAVQVFDLLQVFAL